MSGRPQVSIVTIDMDNLQRGRSTGEYEKKVEDVMVAIVRRMLAEGVQPNTISHSITYRSFPYMSDEVTVSVLGIKPE